MRRAIIRLITFIGGLYFLLEFLLPAVWWTTRGGPFENPLTLCRDDVINFLIVVGTMAFLLGPINLVRSHLTAILKKREGWSESIVFLVFLVLATVATALRNTDERTIRDVYSAVYHVLLHGLLMGFGASSMALLSFYLVSAAYRAFRVSSVDAAFMMAAAVIVLLGLVPLGDLLTRGLPAWLQLKNWAVWILMVPNSAVQRAVYIGACGGAFAAGLRHWLGLGTGGGIK